MTFRTMEGENTLKSVLLTYSNTRAGVRDCLELEKLSLNKHKLNCSPKYLFVNLFSKNQVNNNVQALLMTFIVKQQMTYNWVFDDIKKCNNVLSTP